MSKSNVHIILKSDLKLIAFKMQECHMLSDTSIEERMLFCEMFIEKPRDDAFLENIFFDQTVFDLNPMISKQNCRIWSSSTVSTDGDF